MTKSNEVMFSLCMKSTTFYFQVTQVELKRLALANISNIPQDSAVLYFKKMVTLSTP